MTFMLNSTVVDRVRLPKVPFLYVSTRVGTRIEIERMKVNNGIQLRFSCLSRVIIGKMAGLFNFFCLFVTFVTSFSSTKVSCKFSHLKV